MIIFILHFSGIVFAQPVDLKSDPVASRFSEQLVYFPHEKIYVQTDKAGYLSGERIWLRAHLVDAMNNQPVFMSRYIYVELFNPFDELIKRVKIRPDSVGVYAGHIDLGEELAEGNYTLRAYTRYMRNRGNEAFFRKTINVLDPYSLQIEPIPDFVVSENKVDVSFRFVDRGSGDTIIPEIVTFKLAGDPASTIHPNNTMDFRGTFTLTGKRDNRNLLLSIIHKGRKYNRYYPIPPVAGNFDVSFHPEGGWLVPGQICRVGFKAINPSGLGEDISGALYNSKDEEILTFNSLKFGMGFFNFIPGEDEKYHAVCKTREGAVKRIDLPLAAPQARTVNVKLIRNRFLVHILKGNTAPDDSLSLLIHHKGIVLYHEPCPPRTDSYTFPTEFFPSGISSVLLLDGNHAIISERLIFNISDGDLAGLEAKLSSPVYKRRQRIALTLQLADTDTASFHDNIAVSVVDKKAVIPDTTNNLVSTLLLSSELKGHIESPASYLTGDREDQIALDVLMMTQGWRRYDIPNVLKGKIETPEILPEQYQEISGKAEARFLRSMNEGEISLYATLDTLSSIETTTADDKGRFMFQVEYPDGTEITVQSLSKRGGAGNFISLDTIAYPDYAYATLPVGRLLKDRSEGKFDIDSYLRQANEEYSRKYGVRTIMLEEVTVTGQSMKQFKRSAYYSPVFSSELMTAGEIKKRNFSDMLSLLLATQGIVVRGGEKITTTRSNMPVLLVIDDVVYTNFDVLSMDVNDIDNLFVVKENTSMFGYYPDRSGALVITTQGSNYQRSKSINIDRIRPLGYQQPAEFYCPKYETPEQINSPAQDLRTTIYWQPDVQFSRTGEAIVEFYSADTPTTYQVVGEGVTGSGKMIHFTKEIVIESSVQ
ncbi:hypothetical protein D7D25_09945 [Proteiniphilum sp. X52]|nr:hypothetical protein D7D25_09945 [Proteiniphilum sp. X52]